MTDGQRAAIYTRISRDAEGLRLGVERQRQDLERFTRDHGLEVVARYEDNDISASTRSRKRRPEYERLLSDAKAGQFSVVVAYTSSRLTRRPRENEDLIELAERHGVTFRYVRSPSLDLNTADGRKMARILAANDAAESERISERVKRAAQQRAKQGGFHGGRPAFGYEHVKDPSGRVIAWQPHPEHAAWVREAAKRVLAGESLYGICSDWHGQGRRTGNGADWRSRTLKRALLSPAVVGMREYEGKLHKARWKPILDRKTWDRLRTVLDDDGRQIRPWPARGTARKYALSGLLRCGRCGKVMSSMPATKAGARAFICSTQATGGCGKTRIAMEPLERYVTEMFFAVVDTPEVRAGLGKQDESDEERALREALVDDERRLEQIDNDHYDGLLDRQAWLRQRRRVSERVEQTRKRLAEVTNRAVLSNIPTGRQLRRQWDERDNVWKRTMLSAVIDHIVIKPFPDGMTTNLTRRRDESDEELERRRAEHRAEILRHRVEVVWRV